MTTVAWDGHVLAVDRGGWVGNNVCTMTKIKTVEVVIANRWGEPGDRLIVAVFGWLSLFENTVDHLVNGAELRSLDLADRDMDVAVIINKHRELWQLNATGHRTLLGCHRHNPDQTELPVKFSQWQPDYWHSWAAGHSFAAGALAAGSTAIQAIELANKYTDCAANGVDFVSWKEVFGPYPGTFETATGKNDYPVRSSDEGGDASN